MSGEPTPALTAALDVAKHAAEGRLQAEITVEHVLYGILVGEDGAAIFRACGVDPEEMARDLAEYLDLLPSGRPRAAKLEWRLEQRLALAQRVIQMGGSKQLSIGRMLDVLLRERDSYASKLIYAAGIDRIQLLRAIAHGTTNITPVAPPVGPKTAWLIVRLYNDDFTTMDFVVHVLELVFRFNEAKAQDRMLQIHHAGVADITTLRREEAIERANELVEQASQAGFPLRCTLEPAE